MRDQDEFYVIRNRYRDLAAKTTATGKPQIFFEQLGGGTESDPARIDQILGSFELLAEDGELAPDRVVLAIGPLTYATTAQRW